MKNIYLLFTRSESTLSKMVRFATRVKYSHLSVCFDDQLLDFYTSTRKNGKDLFPAGPCVERFDYGIMADNPQTPCLLCKLPVATAAFEAAKQEAQRMASEPYGFNIVGLLLCLLGIPLQRERHFFCSQFVGEVLARSSAVSLPKQPCLMQPVDFLDLDGLSPVYEGTVGDLDALRQRYSRKPVRPRRASLSLAPEDRPLLTHVRA